MALILTTLMTPSFLSLGWPDNRYGRILTRRRRRGQALRRHRRAARRVARRRARADLRAARPERFGEDHPSAGDRRSRTSRPGPGHGRATGAQRRQRDVGRAGAAAGRDGVPGLGAVPADDRRRQRGVRAEPRERRTARVREVLDMVGLAAFADRHPGTLSGGQQQRVGSGQGACSAAGGAACSTSRSPTSTRRCG